MKNLFSKITGKTARHEYDDLNRQIAEADKLIAPFNDELFERQTALAKSKAVFHDQPSRENLLAWERAHVAVIGAKSASSFDSCFTPLQLIRGEIESQIKLSKNQLKNSSDAMKLYSRCLRDVADGLRQTIAHKKAEVSEKFANSGVQFDIDQVAPIPLWNSRVGHIEKLIGDLQMKLALPSVVMRDALVDECRAAIEADHLNAPAPAAPAPRQFPQQGFPPGYREPGEPIPEPVVVQVTPRPEPVTLAPLHPLAIEPPGLVALRERQQAEAVKEAAAKQVQEPVAAGV
jgi:hypothetical protein